MATKRYWLNEKDRSKLVSALAVIEDMMGKSFDSTDRIQRYNDVGLDTGNAFRSVYVAYSPPTGIPALTEGTGTGSVTGDNPGGAICEIYKYSEDGNDLRPLGRQEYVRNLSNADIAGNKWVLTAQDKFGRWYGIPTAVDTGTSTTIFTLVPTAVVDAFTGPECETGTGTDEGPNCRSRLHLSQLQAWNEGCDRWDDVRCVFHVDINNGYLKIGKRYPAWEITPISGLAAVPVPIDSPCVNPSTDELWASDAGEHNRFFQITEHVGIFCDPTTGTGSNQDDDKVVCYSERFRVYKARERRNKWLKADPVCGYETIGEEVYLIEACGKRLPSAYPLQASYEDTVPITRFEPGDTSNDCRPVYALNCGVTGRDDCIVSIDCVPNTDATGTGDPSICDAGYGDKIVTIAERFLVCGIVVTREVKQYTFPCCCLFNCFPGVSQINCPPCDVVNVENRPTCITITVDSNGACPCIDGSYTACIEGNGYHVEVDACETRWRFGLECIDGNWFAYASCGVCAEDQDPDDPPPEATCWDMGGATVSSCSPFSGTASLGPLVCQQGTCAGVTTLDLTFS